MRGCRRESYMSKSTAGARAADTGFHAGELAVQRKGGTLDEAARLSPMLDPAELRGGIVACLADRAFAVITARDGAGRLWTSPLSGPGRARTPGPPPAVRPARLPRSRGPDHAGDPRSAAGGRPAAQAARRAEG